MTYFKIRSWHIWDMRAVSRANRPYKALCGQRPRLDVATAAEMPMDEKSCESCLRIDRHNRS